MTKSAVTPAQTGVYPCPVGNHSEGRTDSEAGMTKSAVTPAQAGVYPCPMGNPSRGRIGSEASARAQPEGGDDSKNVIDI